RAVASRMATHAQRAPGWRIPFEPTRISRDEVTGLRPIRLHRFVGGAVRPAARSPLRRCQGWAPRVEQRDRDRRGAARHPCEYRPPFAYTRMVTGSVADPSYLEQSGFLNAIQPELVVPIVVFLASRACEFTHHNYSACAGRFVRVFVGLGEGWLAEPGSNPTADDVAAHRTT